MTEKTRRRVLIASLSLVAGTGCLGTQNSRALSFRNIKLSGGEVQMKLRVISRRGTNEWQQFENVSIVGYDQDGAICHHEVGTIEPNNEINGIVLKCSRSPQYITARIADPCSGGDTDIPIFELRGADQDPPYQRVRMKKCDEGPLPIPSSN